MLRNKFKVYQIENEGKLSKSEYGDDDRILSNHYTCTLSLSNSLTICICAHTHKQPYSHIFITVHHILRLKGLKQNLTVTRDTVYRKKFPPKKFPKLAHHRNSIAAKSHSCLSQWTIVHRRIQRSHQELARARKLIVPASCSEGNGSRGETRPGNCRWKDRG